MKFDKTQLIQFFILTISIETINQWMRFEIGNTLLWWLIEALLVLLIFSQRKRWVLKANKMWWIDFFVAWSILGLFRGIFVASNYWEWKTLISVSFFLLLSFSAYLFTNTIFTSTTFNFWLKYGLIGFFIFLPFFEFSDATGRYLAIIPLLFIFFKAFPLRWRLLLLTFAAITVVFGIESRSNILKLLIAIIIGFIPMAQSFAKNSVFKTGRLTLLFAPIVMVALAISGIFNPFVLENYFESQDVSLSIKRDNEVLEESLIADTRTFLYIENIKSAIKNDYVLFGRTPARGYDSDAFGWEIAEELGVETRERYGGAEVAILNIFTWLGLVGVFMYFIIFFKATYLAIYKSNNVYIKCLGLYVAFRWIFSWVEEFTKFDLNFIFLWASIGMCISPDFRAMNNYQFERWVRNLINFKIGTSRRIKLELKRIRLNSV